MIEVLGARVHNLKNIDVQIPRNQLTVITGLSGSGKSSLAFDTIYAEGQRRYIETFAAYARQFLGELERPDVDKISGLSPVIAIEQKTTNKNPRSTVGTITEIYDFLRLWFAKASIAYSHITGEKMIKYTDEQIFNIILDKYKNSKIIILAPIIKGRKGHYRELFASILKKGFLQVRVDGEIREITYGMKLQRYKTHNIEIVIDKIKVPKNNEDKGGIKRLKKSINSAMNFGKGITMVLEKDSDEIKYFSRSLMCPTSGISYNVPAPNSFSFNSPVGYCPNCKGIGEIKEIEINKVIPDKKISIYDGAIIPIGAYKNNLLFWQIEAICKKAKVTLKTKMNKFPEEALNTILYGSDEKIRLDDSPLGKNANYYTEFKGVFHHLNNNKKVGRNSNQIERFIIKKTCPDCGGYRLKKEMLQFKIDDKNILDLTFLDIEEFSKWLKNIEPKLTKKQKIISKEILKEIRVRTQFLLDVGLGYLSLNRSSKTLSGGESQRIRLATQIGSQLVNVLYILDEPSIGLHPKDNEKLIKSLKELRDNQNSVIVVEHDKEMMLSADYIVDIGPFAGKHGGEIVASGTPKEILKLNTLTSQYLNDKKKIEIPKQLRKGSGLSIKIKGAKGNNLKNINVEFPLGKFICVTGVSGSGKSSLINSTLHPILSQQLYKSKKTPLKYKSVEGIEHIDKVVEVSQAPLGRTPRSNPATYTQVFTDIRSLFARLPEAQIRGYKTGRFSFNVKGGRCETCKGAGLQTIEMNFLPDVYVTCKDCNGRRYNRETLDVRFKGKSISDTLDLTIDESVEFFANIPKIYTKVKAMQDVGLGYIKLGQSSTTLSGGESQRVKLSAELSKRATGKTIFILDEPTTGMHFEDVKMLINVLQKIVDKGNTVIVIEHNTEVIKVADHIIDIGKEGGHKGGKIIFTGTPKELKKCKKSYTAKFI